MAQLMEKVTLYLSYPFVQYALIVGVLVALCSSLLGVTLVLKRFSLSATDFRTLLSAQWQLQQC